LSSFLDDRRPGLRPPQFGLRTLLIAVTLSGVFCAAAQVVPAWTMVGVVLLALSIFAHVAGNAIGTRLRANGDTPLLKRSPHNPPRELPVTPASRLSERRTLGWPIVVATLGGLIAGGVGGGVWTTFTMRGPIEPAAISIGVIAFGVLGAMAAFATVAFSLVLMGAMWQALRHPASEPAGSSGKLLADK
jgi:hypothetical protein